MLKPAKFCFWVIQSEKQNLKAFVSPDQNNVSINMAAIPWLHRETLIIIGFTLGLSKLKLSK